jgi:hypothetical protein
MHITLTVNDLEICRETLLAQGYVLGCDLHIHPEQVTNIPGVCWLEFSNPAAAEYFKTQWPDMGRRTGT